MSKYPDVITPEILEKTAHKTDDQIQKDIDDTLKEIDDNVDIASAYDIIANKSEFPHEQRIVEMKALNIRYRNQERRDFVAFLEKLQKARAEQ